MFKKKVHKIVANTIKFIPQPPCPLHAGIEKKMRIIFLLIVFDVIISLINGNFPETLILAIMRLI